MRRVTLRQRCAVLCASRRRVAGSGVEFTRSGDGFRTDADPEHVGKVAQAAGVPLVELRTADGAGLEDMFLELTAETSREGAAA